MTLFAFVLMPFSPKLNRRYDLSIKRAVQDAGMRAERVDKQSFHRQGITERIIQQIQDADILIADMSGNNPNVLYEVGHALAKEKLCILLTTNARTIPFDLKNIRHIVFSGLTDLREKLRIDLEALKIEMELSFDTADNECIARNVQVSKFEIVGRSQATSIRAKVQTTSELHPKNVPAHIIKLERRIGRQRSWKRFDLRQPIQLTWADTDTIATDFVPSVPKYVNVFHIDHSEDNLTIWKVQIPAALADFLRQEATYRVTISVMGRQIQLDVLWRGNWSTMSVDVTKSRVRKPHVG
jgi:nucleoside 2-deoxyribosyltransferase